MKFELCPARWQKITFFSAFLYSLSVMEKLQVLLSQSVKIHSHFGHLYFQKGQLGLLSGNTLKNGVWHLTFKLRLLNNTFLPGGNSLLP